MVNDQNSSNQCEWVLTVYLHSFDYKLTGGYLLHEEVLLSQFSVLQTNWQLISMEMLSQADGGRR